MPDQEPLSLPGWALILGASSGFGAATAVELARAGCNIVGVHLDRRSTMPSVEQLMSSIRELGREAWFYNANAADETRRDQVLDDVTRRFAAQGGLPSFRFVLHSLAFGSLLPLIGDDESSRTTSKQLAMTSNVMAHSLVTWVQALVERRMLGEGGRVYAMTSAGARTVWGGYGAVSAAKASLEAYIRQLAVELASHKVTINGICAGVTDTPALRKIPTHSAMMKVALRKNPHNRLTTPQDVASALVALAQPNTYWLTGNVINVDGGESIVG